MKKSRYHTKNAKPIKLEERHIRRFFTRFSRELSGCWSWTASHHPFGYGLMRLTKDGPLYTAHRISWTIHRGPLKARQQVLHKCDRPACVNPDHLFIGDHTINMRDKGMKGRANPPRGSRHPLAKLTENDVLAIRSSPLSGMKLGAIYGVSDVKIYQIKNASAGGIYRDHPYEFNQIAYLS